MSAESSKSSDQPKLHVDADWKAQAQAEKERLIQKEQTKAAKTSAGKAGESQELPEPTFRSLMSMLASQALMGLGMMMDRETNRVVVDLEGSRFNIDLLDMLEKKTKGNLTVEEAKEIAQVLAELRSRFVQIANLVARQMAEGTANVAPSSSMPRTAGAATVPVSPPSPSQTEAKPKSVGPVTLD